MNRIGNRARRLVALAAVALVATLAAAETRAQRPAEGRYRSCAEAGRLQTPSTVPYNLTYAVVSAPLGGPIQLNVTVTPSANLARVAVNFTTEGIVVLAAPSNQNLTNLVAGTPVTFPVTLNLTGVGGGALFANTRWFEITACGEEPREAEEFPFYVLYTGSAQYTGGSSLLELQVQDVNARLTAMTISAAQASFELDALLAAPLVSPLTEPVFAEGGAGSVSISGTAQWTDSGGGVHPSRQAIVKAFLGNPPATPLVEVGSTVASDAGAFTLVMANAALGASPRDIRVRVLSENFSTRVLFATGATPPMNGVYFLEKVYPAVADNTVITGETLTSGNATTQGRSFSVSDAMIVGNRYIMQVNGTTPALIVTNYPTTGAGTASFFDGATLNIHPSKPFMWDVLLHEYGHYVASLFTLDNNPGGPHACSQNLIASLGKDNGSRLAWGEGLATYLGIAAQLVTNAAALNVPQAGDTSYHSNTAATGAAWQYDNESRDSCNGIGEGVETNVSRALLDVADSAVDGDDVVADGHPGTWNVIKNAAAHNNLSDIWNAIISGKTTQEKINYGATFAQNKVSPAQTAPADGDAIDVMPPTFKWEKHTLNKFRVRFYSDAFAEVGASPELGDVAEWTPTQGEWDPIRAAATNGVLLWVVEGENTAAPSTGVYWSGARRLGGVDFAFIIDDTGSMSEEIDGVRNALLAFLSTFDPTSTAVRFQLTTFKDNVTVRPSTTNLATITADVSALSASGGGDCPEQSVGGVSQGTLAMKSGGTVLLATDADPRPGSDLNALIAALRARGARVNVLLSGTCFGSLTEDWRQQEYGEPFVEAE
ncbi:MAG TPA: hypothetical protein VEI02_00340, partial [Planctomycetota bacterium]|nr:hypothetical protein [Planctomycetota bacterium]